jgi:hypothetical protein
LRLSKCIQEVFTLSRQGIAALSSTSMEESEKETFFRAHSLKLFKVSFVFILKLACIILILYAFYLTINRFFLDMGNELIKASQSLMVMVILTVATLLYVWGRISIHGEYNFIDRLLHHVAFSTKFFQKRLIEFENDIYKQDIQNTNSSREVFIAGLPRSGTTLLLEMLYKTGEFSTFTYRHMPFILSPLLWRRISKSFRITETKKERAHGDGMEVSFESPEAFEEIIWHFYMKKKIVSGDFLVPLTNIDYSLEFEKEFKNTIKRLLVSDCENGTHRYLSKNNANISRIELIYQLFPSSKMIIPFRQPVAHVTSLVNQHKKFLDLHRQNKFSRRYMKWICHYDFGENFKPINFNDWLDEEDNIDFQDLNFWLRYWTAAYSLVIENITKNVLLIDFDKLLSDGTGNLKIIAQGLELDCDDKFVSEAKRLRSPTTKPFNSKLFKWDILKPALAVHEQLEKLAI